MSLEGGTTYPDAILRHEERENREEQKFLDSSLAETWERATISGETEEWIAELWESIERESQVQEVLARFEQLAERESLEWFDVFRVFIEQANEEIQENFLSRIGSRNIRNSSVASWRFPVNEFEFQQSLIEGTILEEINNTIIEREEVGIERDVEERLIRERGQKISLLHQDIDISQFYRWDFSEYERLMNQDWSWNDSERERIKDIQEAIISVLGQWTILEQTILPQAFAQGPEVFERVTRNLVGLDRSFQVRIDAWRLTPNFEKLPDEQMARVSGALGLDVSENNEKARQSGNIFSLNLPGGAVVEYDVMRNERTLSLDGYRLSSQVSDIWDYQTPKLAYMRVEQAHLPQLQKITAAWEALDRAGVDDTNITRIHDILKQALWLTYFTELGIRDLQDVSQIQQKLQEAYREHHDPIEKARNEYRDALISLRNNYMRALRERDKKTREVLEFFKSIWFTEIPQSLTDQIFETLNRSPSRAALYGFNKLPIDFANGNLGIDIVAGESGGLEMPSKVKFAEFVNAILGSEIINITHLQGGTGAPIGDVRQLQNVIANSGILNAGGIARAWENIEAYYTSDPNMQGPR